MKISRTRRLFHFFRHEWTQWNVYVCHNVWTILGTLKTVTYKSRSCTICDKKQHETVGLGDLT